MRARKRRTLFKLVKTAHRMQKASDRKLAEYVKLTTQQAAVLFVLHHAVGNTAKAIALALGLNESAVTPMVKRLVEYGYIERVRSDHDRRAMILSITKAGSTALEASRPPFVFIDDAISNVLSEAEIDLFTDFLERLDRAFCPLVT